MTTPRDSQRSKLYSAENVAFPDSWRQTIPNDQLQAFVDKVLATPAVRRRWPTKTKITVKLGRNGAHADYYGTTITLGVVTRNERVILHEIAHCLTPNGVAHHGPEFAGILLFLVEAILGKAEAANLRAEFASQRVKYTKSAVPTPRSREEEKLVDAVRLAKATLAEAQAALTAYRTAKRVAA